MAHGADYAFVTMRRNIHGHCTRSINHAKGNIPILVARRIPVATTTRNAAAVAWGEPTGHGKHCGGARDGRIIPPRSVYRQSGNVLGVCPGTVASTAAV